MPRLPLLLVAWLAFGPVARAPGQDEGSVARDPARALERQRAYLERSPYNEVVFEQLLETAAGGEGLGTLIAEYRERAGEGSAALVVLARLLARSGALDEALALLERADACVERALLRARLTLERADFDGTLAALDELPELGDLELAFERARLEGRARLGRGERELAAEALLAPARASRERAAALDAAQLLERHGLVAAALEAYELALERAGDDPEASSATWIALGELEARRCELGAAIAAWQSADELLGRTHWRKPEIAAQLTEWHRRTGTQDEWIEELSARSAEAPRDVARREAWARALAASERLPEALAALAPALADNPGDLALARLRLAWLRALADEDALQEELQRVTALHPDERDLVAELAGRLARAGRTEAAAGRFAGLFAAFPGDVGLRRDAAREWAALGETARAVAAFEECVVLAPLDVALVRELVRVLDGDQLPDEAAGALRAARERVAGAPPLTLELARVHLELGRVTEGRALLLELLARVPDMHDARLLLAQLELDGGDAQQARRLLRAVVADTRDGRLRDRASTLYIDSFEDRKARREELARERELLARAPDDRAAPLVLDRLLTSVGDRASATAMLARAVEQRPAELDLREDLARRWRRLGNWAQVLEQLGELERRAPERARLYRAERVEALRRLGRADEALALLASLEHGARKVPQAASDLARAFVELGAPQRALALLEAALGWHPRNTDLRRALAEVELALGRAADAARTLERAYRDAPTERRSELLTQLGNVLHRGDGKLAEPFLARLAREVDASPFDLPGRRLVIGLLLRRRDAEEAARQLDLLLGDHPADLEGLRLRAQLARASGRHADAVRDYERMRALDARFDDAPDLLDSYLQLGESAPAFALAAEVDEPLVASRLLAAHGLEAEAADFLAERMARRRGSAEEWRWLGDLRRRLGHDDAAIDAYEEVERAGGADAPLYLALAELQHARGDLERCLHAVRALMRAPDSGSLARDFLGALRMWRAYDELLAENVTRDPLDERAVERALALLEARPHLEAGRVALAALHDLRAVTLDAGRVPDGHDATSWSARLHDWELAVRLRHARLTSEALRAPAVDGAQPSADDWADLAILLRRAHALAPGDWARLARGVEAHPAARRLAAACAELAEAEREPARALAFLDALLSATCAPEAVAAEERGRAAAHAAQARRLRERLDALGVEYTGADLARAAGLTLAFDGVALGPHLAPITRASLLRRQALQHARSGREEVARALFRTAAPGIDTPLAEWRAHERALALAPGLDAEARGFSAARLAHETREHAGIVAAASDWRVADPAPEPREHAPAVAQHYDRARAAGDVGACLRSVFERGQGAALIATFEPAAEAALARARAASGDETARRAACAAWSKLAELLGWEGRHAEATRAWLRAAALVHAPHRALTEAALAARRHGDVQLATGLMERALEARGAGEDALPAPLPYYALRAAETSHVTRRRWLLATIGALLDADDPYCEQVLLVSLLLESGDHERAVEVLDAIRAERALPWDLEWDLWSLLFAELEDALPSLHDLELLRAFLRHQPGNVAAQVQYVARSLDAGDLARAGAALAACAGVRFPDPDLAATRLAPLEQRLTELAPSAGR